MAPKLAKPKKRRLKALKRRPAQAIAVAHEVDIAKSIVEFPKTWREARKLFGKIAPRLDIKIPHSIQHPITGKWKSLQPKQLCQAITRRHSHMKGVIQIDEWAQRSRQPSANEVGAVYWFWYFSHRVFMCAAKCYRHGYIGGYCGSLVSTYLFMGCSCTVSA